MIEHLYLLATLLFWHFIADYPLQGDFLAKAKAGAFEPVAPWWQAMTAHAFIHAGGVAFIMGSVWFGVAEFVLHFAIDKLKCRNRLSFNQDQALHWGCKVVYVAVGAVF